MNRFQVQSNKRSIFERIEMCTFERSTEYITYLRMGTAINSINEGLHSINEGLQ